MKIHTKLMGLHVSFEKIEQKSSSETLILQGTEILGKQKILNSYVKIQTLKENPKDEKQRSKL